MSRELVPLLLLCPVLVATAWYDLRRMRIPDVLSLIAVGLFLVSGPLFLTTESILMRVLVAGTVFIISFLMFAFRLVGGGDVKIFSALMLFIPVPTVSVFLLLFSAAMFFGMALMPVLRALPHADLLGWVSLKPGAGFPMGISIALSGLAHPIVAAALFA